MSVDGKKKRGDFCFQSDCELTCVLDDDTEQDIVFLGGTYHWIESITNYPDGFSDIKFYDGFTIPQVVLSEIGYVLGQPDIITKDKVSEDYE